MLESEIGNNVSDCAPVSNEAVELISTLTRQRDEAFDEYAKLKKAYARLEEEIVHLKYAQPKAEDAAIVAKSTWEEILDRTPGSGNNLVASRAYRAIQEIFRYDQDAITPEAICKRSSFDFLAVKNCGRKSVDLIRRAFPYKAPEPLYDWEDKIPVVGSGEDWPLGTSKGISTSLST